MVNVYIGPKRKKYHLHKDLLCNRSTFFENALIGGFKEEEECALCLPDDDVGAFVLFVQWIYGAPLTKATSVETVRTLLALYVMAEKFCMEVLKNCAMDLIRPFYGPLGKLPPAEHIAYVYSNTPDSSPMRRFITNLVTYDLFSARVEMPLDVLDLMRKGGDFAADFALATLQNPGDPSGGKKCAWHEHISTKPCA